MIIFGAAPAEFDESTVNEKRQSVPDGNCEFLTPIDW